MAFKKRQWGSRKYEDPVTGRSWDSRFEWRIAQWCEATGIDCSPQPGSFDYRTPVKNGVCLACESNHVGQERFYTPDFHLDGRDWYVEAKGYLRQDKRVLLQHFVKTRRDVPLRFVFQANKPLPLKTAPSYLDWADRLGCIAMVWDDKKGFEAWL